jgi:hypothetical protein
MAEQMRDVVGVTGDEVVQPNNRVPLSKEPIGEM